MEFLLLGPLEVRSVGDRLPLGGPRQRALLADLLLRAGTVVSMDQLIDDLWGADSPPTANAVVQNAIAQLRRTLGREVIETRAPGYVLHAEPGAIDARRFERLLRDAKPLPPGERSAALRDALALWRGPPFADLAYESFLQDEITRLDELRLTALEDRLEAEVELGRHDAVIADAAALAAQHPARERLCRLLMRALHRAGRQQEALDAYEVTRKALDDLWGLEPAAETRALQVMILTQDPAIAVKPELPQPVGVVRRPVALLLAELLLDDELELEVAGSALREARSALGDAAARHGGSLASESGFELVAAFGVEGAREDDVLRSARTAVELREILRGREVDVRLAVGTGRLLVEAGRPVLVGAVVGQTRRALHEAAGGEIVVTPSAARLAGEALELDADGRLHGVRPGRPLPLVEPALFVGRAAELDALRSAFETVVSTRRPRHVVVVGDAGIGKTRLVAEALGRLDAVALEAACVPYGEGITFLPLRELADRAAAVDPDAPELGDLSSADAAFAAARALFEHFTSSDPLVVVLDDVHWAATTFLDLVEYVARAVTGPLLVVSVTRPELLERRPEWASNARALEALRRDEASCLVDSLPERSDLDRAVVEAVLGAADGVPLFLEQLLAHARETALGADAIPPTLETLLTSRIDALEPGERALLTRAAVVGRTFSEAKLRAITPDSEVGDLAGRLAALERRRLLRPAGGDHEFVHALVHDAAYQAIGRGERSTMHEAFARWLDNRKADDELIGVHLERAAVDCTAGSERPLLARQASARLGRAGRRANGMLDHAAARSLLGRAAALLDDHDAERLELECVLGEALKSQGENTLALELLESVEKRARMIGDRRVELRSRTESVWPRLIDGSLAVADAHTVLAEAVTELDAIGDTYGVARVEMTCALVLGSLENRADVARQHAGRAARCYRSIGIPDHTALSSVSYAVHGTTPVPDALSLCTSTMARRTQHIREQAYLRHWLAYLRALLGDLEGAREAAASARLELEQLGEVAALRTSVAATFGSIEAVAESWTAAAEIFRDALGHNTEERFGRVWRAYFLARLGEVALGIGDPHTAARHAEEALRLSPRDDLWTVVWAHRVAGRAFGALGRPRKAVRSAMEAVKAADTTDDLLTRGDARIDLAEVMIRTGKSSAAEEVAREGLAMLDRKGATFLETTARSRLGRLLDEEGGGAWTTPGPANVRISR